MSACHRPWLLEKLLSRELGYVWVGSSCMWVLLMCWCKVCGAHVVALGQLLRGSAWWSWLGLHGVGVHASPACINDCSVDAEVGVSTVCRGRRTRRGACSSLPPLPPRLPPVAPCQPSPPAAPAFGCYYFHTRAAAVLLPSSQPLRGEPQSGVSALTESQFAVCARLPALAPPSWCTCSPLRLTSPSCTCIDPPC